MDCSKNCHSSQDCQSGRGTRGHSAFCSPQLMRSPPLSTTLRTSAPACRNCLAKTTPNGPAGSVMSRNRRFASGFARAENDDVGGRPGRLESAMVDDDTKPVHPRCCAPQGPSASSTSAVRLSCGSPYQQCIFHPNLSRFAVHFKAGFGLLE